MIDEIEPLLSVESLPERMPSGSHRGLLFVAALLLAAFLSVCMAHLLEVLAPAFHTGDEVTRLLDIPVLATTPSND